MSATARASSQDGPCWKARRAPGSAAQPTLGALPVSAKPVTRISAPSSTAFPNALTFLLSGLTRFPLVKGDATPAHASGCAFRAWARVKAINHPKRTDLPARNLILHERQRAEAGFYGLARANLRFSEQGGP